MKYSAILIIAASFCSSAGAAPESTTCDSPCDCHDAYGEGRWSVKTDASLPPTDASAIQAALYLEVRETVAYAKFYSCSCDATIRVYDVAGNVIETRQHKADLKEQL